MKRPLKFKLYVIAIVSLHITGNIQAQKNQNAKDAVVNNYFSSIGEHATIYRGKEQVKYPSFYKNDPYYKTSSYQEGALSFDGVVYPNVKLRLDLYQKELSVLSLDSRFNIIIPNDRLDYAYMGSDYVIINNSEPLMPTGINIRIHDGKYPVWLSHHCTFSQKVEHGVLTNSFSIKKRFYVYKDGIYHKVGSKSSLLKLFPDQKKELKRFIKSTDLSFRSFPEKAITEVVKQYEILSAL